MQVVRTCLGGVKSGCPLSNPAPCNTLLLGLLPPPLASLQHLKEEIHKRGGIPPCHQRLVHGPRQLEDGRTLGDCGVGPCATLHLLLRLRGGMESAPSHFEAPLLEEDVTAAVSLPLATVQEDPAALRRVLEAHGFALVEGVCRCVTVPWGRQRSCRGGASAKLDA